MTSRSSSPSPRSRASGGLGKLGLGLVALVPVLLGCERLPASRTAAVSAEPSAPPALAVPVQRPTPTLKPKNTEEADPTDPTDPTTPADPKADAVARADTLLPLTDEQRAILTAGGDEALPRRNLSFIKSNEIRHDLWFPYIAGTGGAYVGLGSDTNYTLIGVARSEVVFLFDRDPLIANVHRVYEILIEASPDLQTLHERFSPEQRDASLALLDAAIADLPPKRQRGLRRTYRATRETLWRYQRPLLARQRDGCPSTWLSDQDSYDHVRTLFQQDRVRIMVGDLRGDTTMPTIITALEALEIPVKVLYLSNAEQYFTYNKGFRRNLGALPAAPDGVVLRTIYEDTWEHADNYWNYQVHDIEDFQRRLGHAFLTRSFMWRDADREGLLERTTERKGLSRLAIAAPASPGESAASTCRTPTRL